MFRPATSLRTPSRTFFAELYLTPGPQEIGVTGDNSYATLYGSEWLFSIEDGTRILRAYQRLDGEWVERADDARMPPIVGQAMDENVRRLSGTFDQAARVVVAYEDGEGVVRVTRWDPSANQYVQNVTFAGVDPCVVMDASWRYLVPDSDVLLFYLSPDRTRVLCRVQRDVYAVEHEIWDYGQPVILDRVIALPYKYQVLVADDTGAPLPSVLVSDLYPVAVATGVQLEPEFLEGEYRQVAYQYSPTLAVELIPEFVGGALTLPVTTYSPLIGVELSPEFHSGVLKDVVTQYAPTLGVELAPEFVMSALDDIGVPYAPSVGVELSPEFIGGTYEPG